MFNDQSNNDMPNIESGEDGLQNQSSNSNGENLTMPLGIGSGFTSDETIDPLAGAESGSRINTGALLIVAVIFVAAGGLFVMRTLARATAASSGDTTTEEKINSFLNVLTGEGSTSGERKSSVLVERDTSAIDVLSESYTDRQVPLDLVQRNPFVINEDKAATQEPVRNEPVVDNREQQRLRAQQDKMQRFEQAAKRLRVTSTMLGSTPLAYINGDVRKIGDVIYVESEDVSFRITDIQSNAVHAFAEDRSLDVSLPVVLNINMN